MTEAQLRLFYERVMARSKRWRIEAMEYRRLLDRDAGTTGVALDACAADIDAIAKEVGSE